MEFDNKKTVGIDMKELYTKTVRFDMKKLVVTNIKKQYPGIIGFLLILLVLIFIGYQIGRDAASRDRQNSMRIEKNR